ncbi:MAG TPA: response regulator [Pseudomonadota bacterium]|nr:response regulator [Pseudomonadota bacterium]
MSKILIVEDNEFNRDMLSRRLSRKGFDVLVAEDGNSGIQLARTAHPDIILMDVSLPDIDGLEITRQLKADDKMRAIPIIVITAHAMVGDRQQSLEAGADDYHMKPVELAMLLTQIQALLARAGQ